MIIADPPSDCTPSEANGQVRTGSKVLLLLLRVISNYVLLEDVAQYCFALAVAVSTYFEGDPLWGMIVGAASGGKTEAIKLVDEVADEHVDSLTQPALLSAYKPKLGVTMPVGILVRVGAVGFLTIADFSTVLSGSPQRRDDLFAALRRVYDGEFQRDLGNEPVPLRWAGRLTLLAACTSAIDNYAAHSDALGPRWVYLRLNERSEQMKRKILKVARRAKQTREARNAATGIAKTLVLKAAKAAIEHGIELSEDAAEAIDDAAVLTAYGRGVVPRDYKREVDGPSEIEEPTRVAKQLGMLCQCLVAIGLNEQEAVGLTSRVALDSMPAMRAKVLMKLAELDGPITGYQMAKALRWDPKTASRVMEDLEWLGFLERVEAENAPGWGAAISGAVEAKPWTKLPDRSELVRRVVDRRNTAILPEVAGQA
jgi:hypothetical protein